MYAMWFYKLHQLHAGPIPVDCKLCCLCKLLVALYTNRNGHMRCMQRRGCPMYHAHTITIIKIAVTKNDFMKDAAKVDIVFIWIYNKNYHHKSQIVCAWTTEMLEFVYRICTKILAKTNVSVPPVRSSNCHQCCCTCSRELGTSSLTEELMKQRLLKLLF